MCFCVCACVPCVCAVRVCRACGVRCACARVFLLAVGTSQGVRRSTGFVATIMGPLWAGAFLSHLTFMLAVEVGLVAMILVS